jgi:hypothetical protein
MDFKLEVPLPEISFITKMCLMEIGCEAGRWMELARDLVPWPSLALAALFFSPRILLPDFLGYCVDSLVGMDRI